MEGDGHGALLSVFLDFLCWYLHTSSLSQIRNKNFISEKFPRMCMLDFHIPWMAAYLEGLCSSHTCSQCAEIIFFCVELPVLSHLLFFVCKGFSNLALPEQVTSKLLAGIEDNWQMFCLDSVLLYSLAETSQNPTSISFWWEIFIFWWRVIIKVDQAESLWKVHSNLFDFISN